MLLAGDIGGTKSRLAIFADGVNLRKPLIEKVLQSSRYPGLDELIAAFLKSANMVSVIDQACFAVPGPATEDRAVITNLPWIVKADEIRRRFGFRSVRLLNDLAATARAVPLLRAGEIHTLCKGEPAGGGVIAVIAPGTGLGEAFLTRDGGGLKEHASEGGHADFAPATPLETDLLRRLQKRLGHVSYERVCSGPGLWNIYRYLRDKRPAEEPEWLKAKINDAEDPVPLIIETALADRSGICGHSLKIFCSILGAEAGNLALKTLALGGVYIGGGIAPRIVPYLEEGLFMEAFRRKGRMAELIDRIPIHIILEPRAALIGAAAIGTEL